MVQIFEEMYEDDERFADFPFREDRYKTRINNIWSKIETVIKWAHYDSMVLQNDNLIHPKTTTHKLGKPQWNGSEAERLLPIDVEAGLHLQMKPAALQMSRTEYQVFVVDVFRKHSH